MSARTLVICLGCILPGSMASGCGSSSGASSDASVDSGPVVTADGSVGAARACDEYAIARCSALSRCNRYLLELTWGDVDTCRTREKLGCAVAFDAFGTSATIDRLQSCTVAIGSQNCPDMLASVLLPPCIVTPGRVPEGAGCGGDAQCVSTFCAKAGGVCGVCAKRPLPGTPCKEDVDCGRGMSCVHPRGGGDGCHALGRLGEACDQKLAACAPELSCFAGTCVAAARLGAPCDPDQVSAPNCDLTAALFCGFGPKNCLQIRFAKAGESCGTITAVGLSLCGGGGICQGGVCRAAAGDGELCLPPPNPGCMSPARCVSGQCKLPNAPSCK